MNVRRLSRVVAVSVALAAVVAALATPPDPFTQLLAGALLVLVFVPVGYVLDAVWTADGGADEKK